MNEMLISRDVAEAIAHFNHIAPRAKAVAAFFEAEEVLACGNGYTVRCGEYDAELLEKIKWDFRVFCEVEKRIAEAEKEKEDDDFFFMESEEYTPRPLEGYAVPCLVAGELNTLSEKIAKYTEHVKKDLETLEKTRHPEKYFSRYNNHARKLENARFKHDVLMALKARFEKKL